MEGDEHDNTTESGPDDTKLASTSASSPKPRKRGVRKRVVAVPIKEVEGAAATSLSRLKGSEIASPPSDSWAWRKYGQKPIKGSPYPRGYYRCSSWKGCPARKQVERSRVDPTTLVVTYSSDHDHTSRPPPPSSRSYHNQNTKLAAAADNPPESSSEPDRERFANFEDELSWLGEMDKTSAAAILAAPVFAGAVGVGMSEEEDGFSPMREEDESLFADLGELPECTMVFRHHRGMGTEVTIC